MSSSAKSKPPLVQSFRPDFCSPGYLNSLLRQQQLHWLEVRRRPGGPSGDGVVSSFQFVILATQLNLTCVLGTEMPRLETELGCRLRQIPVPDFVAPNGLKAFSVEYATESVTTHTRFLSTLKAICVRLQLTQTCVDPSGSSNCVACSRVRTHTKSVRGASAVRARLRPPQLTLDLARQRTRRPASAETAVAGRGDFKAAAKIEVPPAKALDSMAEAAVSLLTHRLMLTEAAADETALAAVAVPCALRVCSGTSSPQRSHWRQHGLDFLVASVVADAILVREHLCAEVTSVFDDWSAELSDRLFLGCLRLVSEETTVASVAATSIADIIAGGFISNSTCAVSAEVATAERQLVRVSLPCDWRTRRSLLALRPVLRRCPGCGARVIAEACGPSGFRLTIMSRGRCCTRHASMLQLADCSRSTKDAALGGLLLQEVAALPAWTK